jgi:hypothetical protein
VTRAARTVVGTTPTAAAAHRKPTMSKHAPKEIGLFEPAILGPALGQSVKKLDPRSLARNPVIFVTALVSVATTLLVVRDGLTGGPTFWIGLQIAVWLWLTVLFANFAEAVAEGRGKARAEAFRATRTNVPAKVLLGVDRDAHPRAARRAPRRAGRDHPRRGRRRDPDGRRGGRGHRLGRRERDHRRIRPCHP